ncbi:MAG: CRISPR-associated protein Cas4 [Anaerolineaceae bacterium]|nr:CRISPR-associated protein Cas4 [Anaerolineaceae bacterium]
MIAEDSFVFRVIDLKQYVYCPRILYYHTVLPQVRPLTYKMEAGIAAHTQTEQKEKRRSLRTYGLQQGERQFNVPLYAPELYLSGELDMLIETATELIPVDFKQSKQEGEHFRLQLLAYGRLLNAICNPQQKTIRRGFLYLIPSRQAVEVSFTPALQRKFDKAMAQLHLIAEGQQMPEPTKKSGRCVDCEFRRFCNDVL